MRQEFCEVETEEEASDICLWADIIIEVNGGYICFESARDAEIWESQE